MIKMTFFSEDYPEGMDVECPVVPRLGEWVTFNHRGGTTNQTVHEIRHVFDRDRNFIKIEVRLTY
jgi:hypothetical protein